MALQGNIDSFSVVDVLRLLGSSSKSGRLVVQGDRGTGSLWLIDGLVVGGTTGRDGGTPIASEPHDVLFDVLRFVEGAFEFEAGVEAPDVVRVGAPVAIEPLIDESEQALAEWDQITAVVPSIRSQLTLAVDLAGETVTLDRRSWGGIVAVAAGAAEGHGATSVDTFAHLACLAELPAMRLARDLVLLGLVEVGNVVAEERHFEPAFAVDPFADPGVAGYDAPLYDAPMYDAPLYETPQYETPAFEPPAHEAPVFEPAFGAVPSVAPVFERDEQDSPVFEPAGFDSEPPPFVAEPEAGSGPAAAPDEDGGPFVAGPIGAIRSPEAFDAFAPFDPFGTADVAPDVASEPDVSLGWEPTEEPSAASMFEPAEPDVAAPQQSEEETAAQQAEFARQLAMLSPRAAEAVASAEAGPSTEDDERARVARFLGSV